MPFSESSECPAFAGLEWQWPSVVASPNRDGSAGDRRRMRAPRRWV
jgi:hypothetical protein